MDLKEAVSYILEEALEIFKDESEEVFIASLFYAFEVTLQRRTWNLFRMTNLVLFRCHLKHTGWAAHEPFLEQGS